MAPNHKLTNLIKGRTVVGTAHEADKTIVTFDDGSTMRVKNPPESSAPPESWLDKISHAFPHDETTPAKVQAEHRGAVKMVMQNDTTLVLEFEDGAQMEIALAEASSSVMLRAKDETMEYAD